MCVCVCVCERSCVFFFFNIKKQTNLSSVFLFSCFQDSCSEKGNAACSIK